MTLEHVVEFDARRLEGRRLVLEERARWFLAGTFAVAFIGTLGCSFYGAIHIRDWADVREWLEVMLPAVTGLFGSALGFYFGRDKL
jgi:hypothetical protein